MQTSYPGASPEVMAATVTAPLERQFGQMADLNRMSSISSGGSSVITLQFNLDLSLDVAEQEVQAAINAASSLLPTDLPAPPDLRQGEPGRRAGPDPGADLQDPAAAPGGGLGGPSARPEDLPGHGRGPGLYLAAASGRRCGSRPTPTPWPPTA